MTVTYADLQTIQKCVQVAHDLECGVATFVIVEGTHCAHLFCYEPGAGKYAFGITHIACPEIMLATGFAPSFATAARRAESILRVLDDADDEVAAA